MGLNRNPKHNFDYFLGLRRLGWRNFIFIGGAGSSGGCSGGGSSSAGGSVVPINSSSSAGNQKRTPLTSKHKMSRENENCNVATMQLLPKQLSSDSLPIKQQLSTGLLTSVTTGGSTNTSPIATPQSLQSSSRTTPLTTTTLSSAKK